MPSKKTSRQKDQDRVVPLQRFRWFDYVEEDAEDDEIPYRLKMRTNITYGELQVLTDEVEGKATDRELWPIIAPFVVDWNVSGVDSDGNDVAIPAPAIGGPEQFEYIPPQLFARVYWDIMRGGTPPLARKPLARSEATPEP